MEELQTSWDNRIGNKLLEIKPNIGEYQSVFLARLLLGHTRVTHSYLLQGAEQPQCCGYNVLRCIRNNRISDGCLYAQIRKGLGMHLVTYTNRDTVPFLLVVQYKGGLSEMEFIVSLFSNACTISLLFLKILEILCTFHYNKDGISHFR